MSSFLSDISSIFTMLITWFTAILNFVTSNPSMMALLIGLPVASYVVNLFRRLIYS